MSKQQARGVRNNNPGNIDYNPKIPWQGLDNPPTDGRFCRFTEPKWGIRAIVRLLTTYKDKHKIDTVRKVINRWAPPVENDTDAYVRVVADKCGVLPDDKIDILEPVICEQLVRAIIKHENGYDPYPDSVVHAGMVLAGVEPVRKPLSASRTVKGGQVAVVATAGTAAVEMIGQVEMVKTGIEPLIAYSDAIKWIFIAVTLVGIGIMLWARVHDRQLGLR